MTFEMRGEASVHIDAPADEIYNLVSDITRMGEWSPECVGADWIEGANEPGTVGAQFMGRNKRADSEWTTPNTVLVADEGREFTWVVGSADMQLCRWRFVFTPSDGATKVTESFELGDVSLGFRDMVSKAPVDEQAGMIDARRSQLIEDMKHTLERLKERVEAK